MPNTVQQVTNYLAQQIPNAKFLAVFEYGSVVYGYKKPADQDFIVIIKSDYERDKSEYYKQFKFNNFEMTVMSEGMFLHHQLERYEITALECVFMPKKNILFIDKIFEEKLNITVNKQKLRHSISQKASNSYVKAKKKLIVEEDYDLQCSIKSLWHSFRILEFGKQLAEHGKIVDFTAMNYLYPMLVQIYEMYENNWDRIHEDAKPIHNQFASEFKALAPKE